MYLYICWGLTASRCLKCSLSHCYIYLYVICVHVRLTVSPPCGLTRSYKGRRGHYSHLYHTVLYSALTDTCSLWPCPYFITLSPPLRYLPLYGTALRLSQRYNTCQSRKQAPRWFAISSVSWTMWNVRSCQSAKCLLLSAVSYWLCMCVYISLNRCQTHTYTHRINCWYSITSVNICRNVHQSYTSTPVCCAEMVRMDIQHSYRNVK